MCPPNIRSKSRCLSVWLSLASLHAVDVYGKINIALCLVVRGNKSLMTVQRKFREPPHVNNIRRWFEQFKEPWSVCKKCHLGDLQLKPGFNCSWFFLLEVHQEHCVRRKSKRDATPDGQNLSKYWNNHARDASSCMGGRWIQSKTFQGRQTVPILRSMKVIAHVKFVCFSSKIQYFFFLLRAS